MDAWGIVIFVVGLVLYYATKKKVVFMFISGVGAGIVIGAIWAVVIVSAIMG